MMVELEMEQREKWFGGIVETAEKREEEEEMSWSWVLQPELSELVRPTYYLDVCKILHHCSRHQE